MQPDKKTGQTRYHQGTARRQTSIAQTLACRQKSIETGAAFRRVASGAFPAGTFGRAEAESSQSLACSQKSGAHTETALAGRCLLISSSDFRRRRVGSTA